MAETPRERAVENLAVSSLVGFIAVLLTAASLFTESFSISNERALVASSVGPILDSSETWINDPAFSRVYAVKNGAARFAVVLCVPGQVDAFRAVALFKGDGSLVELRGGGGPIPSWLGDLVISTTEIPPQSARDDLERYLAWADAARRASLAVASFQEAAQ